MCVMSMVHDSYTGKFPDIVEVQPWIPIPPVKPATQPFALSPALDLVELRQLIAEFKQCVAAAKLIDEKTGQPDCVDPEKFKLTERVAELERLLNRAPEFVMVKGANLEPGRYRVIDGGLFKVVE